MDIPQVMMDPSTYDEPVSSVKLMQTHISWVFLTGRYAYKVKKPVNFGFLDYTTLDRRRHFCEQEVVLNRRLAGDMYIGVLPLTRSGDRVQVDGKGDVVEYLVKMRELPQEALMSNLLAERKVDVDTIDRIANILAGFHRKAATGGEVDRGGSMETIRFNWSENFDQTKPFVETAISKHAFDSIMSRVNSFLTENEDLMNRRVSDGRIRDCHGDVHSRSIFITDRIYIFDCIEFNDRFRYSDVTADIAFLSMDLDHHGRADLSKHFVRAYLTYSSDEGINDLLPFYECYRAFVRGKVACLGTTGSGMREEEKRSLLESAREYFDLSFTYAEQL